MNVKYTILRVEKRVNGWLYEVFVDDAEGFTQFQNAVGAEAAPGSIVDIADAKAVFRLRHDGNWEKLRSYAASEEEAAELEASMAEALLDAMVPDEAIEEVTA